LTQRLKSSGALKAPAHGARAFFLPSAGKKLAKINIATTVTRTTVLTNWHPNNWWQRLCREDLAGEFLLCNLQNGMLIPPPCLNPDSSTLTLFDYVLD
jgi:hypothetical protein